MQRLEWKRQPKPNCPGEFNEWFIRADSGYKIKGDGSEVPLIYTIAKANPSGRLSYTAYAPRINQLPNMIGKPCNSSEEAKKLCEDHLTNHLKTTGA